MTKEFDPIDWKKNDVHSKESVVCSSTSENKFRKRKNEILENYEGSSKKIKVDQRIEITGSTTIQDLMQYSLDSKSSGYVSEYRLLFFLKTILLIFFRFA